MDSILPYCTSVVNSQNGGIYSALFMAGLVSGFTHCAGMCGPFVVMQSSANMSSDRQKNFSELSRLKNSSLLPYHIGRITTYTTLGMVAAYLSSLILAFDGMRWFASFVLGLSGLFFVSYAISKSKSSLLGINMKLPKILEEKAKPFFKDPRGLNGYGLGLILGLIPCGMIVGAIMAVASTGDIVSAMVGMLFFGLGTIPGLFSVSYGSNFLLDKLRIKNFQKVAIFFSGIVLLSTAYGILL